MTTAPDPHLQPGADPAGSLDSVTGAPEPTTPDAVPEPTATPKTPSPTARTRISSTYVSIGVGFLVLILLLIFIIQNLNDASFHYLGLHFRLPVGLLMLISMVAGGVIVLLASLARIAQLRVRSRRAQHSGPARVR